MKYFLNILLSLIFFSLMLQVGNAANLAGLQECQAIKNATKKADCFEKQTQKLIQDENEKSKKEEVEKAEAERAKLETEKARQAAEAARLEADKARAKKDEKAKIIVSAKEVIKSLKKLENRIETGISYKDYPSVFSEARFVVKNFIEAEDSSKVPQFRSFCSNAIKNYSDVQAVWRQRIEDSDKYNNDVIYSNGDLIDSIRRIYPATSPANNGRSMKASYVMQVIWSEASDNIRKAESSLRAWESLND